MYTKTSIICKQGKLLTLLYIDTGTFQWAKATWILWFQTKMHKFP